MISNMRYGTMDAWSASLEISRSNLAARLGEAVSELAFSTGGVTAKFYSETDVRTACADLSPDLPKADRDNFIRTEEGKTYATIRRWADTLAIGENAVKKRMAGIEPLKGKDCLGRERAYFEQTAVATACADLIKILPRADHEGFILTEE